jgi:hypothetical protein
MGKIVKQKTHRTSGMFRPTVTPRPLVMHWQLQLLLNVFPEDCVAAWVAAAVLKLSTKRAARKARADKSNADVRAEINKLNGPDRVLALAMWYATQEGFLRTEYDEEKDQATYSIPESIADGSTKLVPPFPLEWFTPLRVPGALGRVVAGALGDSSEEDESGEEESGEEVDGDGDGELESGEESSGEKTGSGSSDDSGGFSASDDEEVVGLTGAAAGPSSDRRPAAIAEPQAKRPR